MENVINLVGDMLNDLGSAAEFMSENNYPSMITDTLTSACKDAIRGFERYNAFKQLDNFEDECNALNSDMELVATDTRILAMSLVRLFPMDKVSLCGREVLRAWVKHESEVSLINVDTIILDKCEDKDTLVFYDQNWFQFKVDDVIGSERFMLNVCNVLMTMLKAQSAEL